MRLYALIIVCIMLLTAGVGISSEPNRPGSSKSIKAGKKSSGPAVVLDYDEKASKKNPASSFMYFIPLISPVSVIRETSADNEQQGGSISYKKTADSKSFYATCGFTMEGKGFQKYIFDPAEMIARNTDNLKEGELLINILNWIRFEGEGTGLFEVRGTINGSEETVTEVIVNFNAGGPSPVTAGLYSVVPQDGQYKYENKYNEIIARVNSLTFKRSENNPKMAIKLASVRKKTEAESFKGDFEAFIANFFIKPLEVDKLGNDTMLNLGKAIADKRTTFIFPKANNIKKDSIVKANQEE
ncbi:MAG: hypothetical protein ABSE89_05080 [Sedimentisphaerales bacterium]